ncbi:S-adenosyl-L-methionine-dependent methyltransferase [Agrocybe pediades]|nr:S-adenosyl-L-methionine-dependent methyltransferase [Agrocybe pediades]
MASVHLTRAIRASTSCLRHELRRATLSYNNASVSSRSTYATVAATGETKPKKRAYKKKTDSAAPSVKLSPEDIAASYKESTNNFTELPPDEEWKTAFPTVREHAQRVAVRSPEVAKQLAESIAPEGSKDLIIIEASPGPGLLSRALLNLPKERVKKLILLDSSPIFLPYLKPLESLDSRVSVFPYDAFNWATYKKIKDEKALDEVETCDDWSQVHPQLRFTMTMSANVHGEQMASQLIRAVSDRQWLFQYGRVPLNLILQARMYDRLKAEPETSNRCKVSVMAQCNATLTELVPYDDLQPYHEKFHPARVGHASTARHTELDARRVSSPLVAIQCIPKEKPVIAPGDLDFWDYCVRKLFVQKATPLSKSITALGPGANNLLKTLEATESPNYVDTSKASRALDLQDWSRVVNTFKEWPFRPTDLSIDNLFMRRKHD